MTLVLYTRQGESDSIRSTELKASPFYGWVTTDSDRFLWYMILYQKLCKVSQVGWTQKKIVLA